jgi:hypothetical protein
MMNQAMGSAQGSKYPDAADMPELQGTNTNDPNAVAQDAVQGNPVIQALKTLQTAILSMVQQGQPGADGIQAKFMELLQSFTAGQGAGQAPAPSGPAGAPAAVPTPPQGGAVAAPGGAGAMAPNAVGKTAKPMI